MLGLLVRRRCVDLRPPDSREPSRIANRDPENTPESRMVDSHVDRRDLDLGAVNSARIGRAEWPESPEGRAPVQIPDDVVWRNAVGSRLRWILSAQDATSQVKETDAKEPSPSGARQWPDQPVRPRLSLGARWCSGSISERRAATWCICVEELVGFDWVSVSVDWWRLAWFGRSVVVVVDG